MEKFKEDLAAHMWFRDGGVHREGAEYDHLKRFRKRLDGVMTIESNPKYLDAVLELPGLEGAKGRAHAQCSCSQGKAHDWRIAESSRDHSVQTVRWRFALLHARQSRCTVRGVNSGIDVGKTDSRIDDRSETRDSLLEGNETLRQQT